MTNNESNSRFWQIFFEVFEPLPRQGPGSLDSARRALSLCAGLPPSPVILDLGCGAGGQTLQLAGLTSGVITAVDSHPPSIERLQLKIAAQGLGERVRALVDDMAHLELPFESADLIWSEGAFYNIGIPTALSVSCQLLRPGGYLAFTDAVWRKENPPAEVKQGLFQDYPEMGTAADVLERIRMSGLKLIGNFTLPDEDWWVDFYTPMEARIGELRDMYAADSEALSVLNEIAVEPDMHRRYASYYGYEFFVARKL